MQYILLLILLLTFVQNGHMYCTDKNNCWTPFPNMESGLIGYDPAFSNPFHEIVDPGLRNQIFRAVLLDNKTKEAYLPDYISALDNLR